MTAIKVETYDKGTQAVKFTSLGCYPIFYVTNENNCLCPDCALALEKDPDTIEHNAASDANWEDPDLYCDDCGSRIESAYAEKD